MTADSFSRELLYHASLSPFKKMLFEGLITDEEYAKVDTILSNKYHPFFGRIIDENPMDIVSEQR